MAIIPVKNLSTKDILYGDRTTQYRWEVLEHSNGVDYLVGTLDGVSDGSLSWIQNAAVKGRGKMEVLDLEAAQPGMLRIGELELESARIRPVMTLNAFDQSGSYQEKWVEQRRNLALNPAPVANSTYSSSSASTVDSNGFLTITNNNTRYIFSTYSELGAVAGHVYAMRCKVKATSSVAGGTFYVRPHKNVGNVYYTPEGGYPTFPQDGLVKDVAFYFIAPTDMAPNDAFNLAAVSLGGAAADATLSMKDVMIEDVGTVVPSVPPLAWFSGATTSAVPYRRFRWLGVVNQSSSVQEVRTQEWVSSGESIIPEIPWGTFLVENAKEDWNDTGRVWNISLLDRTTVPSQDVVDQSYAVAAGTNILAEVRSILATSGEYMAIDDSVTLATSNGMVWEAGTSKLSIINDLLDSAGYNSLTIDGYGNFQATPRVLPADRSIQYELLGFPRELKDGEESIYEPRWTRERDSFKVPNKVIAIQSAGGEDEQAIVGQWTNEDPASPYSYPRKGRWIPEVLDSVETPEGTPVQIQEFLNQRARATLIQMSAVQAEVKVSHLPIPVRVGDVLQFANTRADIDARHVITRLDLDTRPTGLMKSTLQEVISL